MNDDGKLTEPGTIVFQRLLPGPIERVWEYLTDSDKRGLWLASGEMDLRIGGRVELKFRHRDLSPVIETVPDKYKSIENGASFTGRVTACEPPRLLSYTWAESWNDDSEVTFELTPQGDQVRLVLTHRRLVGRDTLISVAAGWHTHLAILADRLQDRTPSPFWSVHAHYESHYANYIQE